MTTVGADGAGTRERFGEAGRWGGVAALAVLADAGSPRLGPSARSTSAGTAATTSVLVRLYDLD